MKKKAFFIKHLFDYPINKCFYCGLKPTGILTFIETGEEIRTCEICAGKYGKIKRFRKNKGFALPYGKSKKKNEILRIKNKENEVLI
jgi:hypothetical protein